MEIKPYSKNAKKHPEKQLKELAAIVGEVGWRVPCLVNQDGIIIAGHGRWACYSKYKEKFNLKEIWIINDSGETVMGEPEKTPMTEQQEKMYRLADNKVAESDWDMGLVVPELKELSEEMANLTGFDIKDRLDDVYTKKVVPPTYEPSGDDWNVKDLYDDERTRKFIKEIKDSDLPDNEKSFLISSAHRLTVFDYAKIADYYARGGEVLKRLMERMALIVIDYDEAIEYGYVNLCDKIFDNLDDEINEK